MSFFNSFYRTIFPRNDLVKIVSGVPANQITTIFKRARSRARNQNMPPEDLIILNSVEISWIFESPRFYVESFLEVQNLPCIIGGQGVQHSQTPRKVSRSVSVHNISTRRGMMKIKSLEPLNALKLHRN